MPFISLIVPTMRVGGLDILFDSLAKQTFRDFELVLVDAFYKQRKDRVAEEARDRFLCVHHVGLDPSPFPVCAFSLYSNAGIIASNGDVLAFMVDYSHLPPDLLAKHAKFHKADPTGRAGMMGPHRYLHLNAADGFPIYGRGEIDRYEADVRSGALDQFMFSNGRHGNAHGAHSEPHEADGGAIVPHDADPKLRLPPGRIGPEFFHAKNESVRRERVLEVDGYDLELDGAHLYQDTDFADRLTVKAGVQWLLDPTAIVDIVNPRHVFPFAKRLRPHESNKGIWEKKKAAGYPDKERILVDLKGKEKSAPARVEMPKAPEKLRIGMIYGEFSSAIHGPFDLEGLYTRTGLTGSESSFFNLMRTLAERGHEVVAFCDCTQAYEHPSGATIVPIKTLPAFAKVQGVSAVIAWNEPDYLVYAPPGVPTYCDQQLNDFGYCRNPNWQKLVTRWISPSHNHRQNVMAGLTPCDIIPNSVDLDLFAGDAPQRNPNRVVWCSSPDRGLHHLLSLWPLVKRRKPEAELRIFYRLADWLARCGSMEDEAGRRARYIEAALPRLNGYGVTVYDVVPNAQMAKELRSAQALAYTCDPIRYTEGFGCSVLDAAAGGCLPIISDADALPSVHGDAAVGIAGPPGEARDSWVEAICAVLEGRFDAAAKDRMRAHAQKHSRHAVAMQWEKMLLEDAYARRGASQVQSFQGSHVSLR